LEELHLRFIRDEYYQAGPLWEDDLCNELERLVGVTRTRFEMNWEPKRANKDKFGVKLASPLYGDAR
jgi:hypothetical protein